MGAINTTQTIAAPVDKVWAAISDPSTWESWLTIHAGWLAEPPATLSVGANLVEKVVMLGMANKLEWTVTALEEGQRLEVSGTGMAGVKAVLDFTLAPAGDSTEANINASFTGALIIGALGKAVEKDSKIQLAESLEKLTAYLG